MSQFPQTQRRPWELEYGTDDKAVFNFFNAVYAWMAVGLAVTAAVAWFVSQSQLVYMTGGRGFAVAFLLGAAVLSFAIQGAAMRLSAAVATGLFLLYAALIGGFIAPIFLVYKMGTIVAAFVMTGGVFGVMSVYGFVTKRDLTSMGSFLVMAVVGLFLASLVNIFWANNALSWIITYAVLAVFIGLTAYRTQQLKEMAIQLAGNADMASRVAIIGSLSLYISFINMFLSILRILGDRR
jgi:FtsH-binding integral membrane protein